MTEDNGQFILGVAIMVLGLAALFGILGLSNCLNG